MREHFGVTITTYRGARHYTITQLMQRFAVGFAGLLLAVFLVAFLTIYFLSYRLGTINSELTLLQQQQQHIKEENRALLAEQSKLQKSVEEKVTALSVMGEELSSIESMMGLSPDADAALYQRLDTASQTAQEKQYMLTTIPSGYPLDDPTVTSLYGMRKHPVLGRMAMHRGVDLRANIGTPVYATADGVVEWSGDNDGGYGKMVKLGHNFGFDTLYGHLDKTTVSAGDYVRQGQLIGYSGNTGRSSAPHLHYEVRHLNRRLPPTAFMEWSLENYDGLFSREERIKWDSLARTLRKQIAVPERRWSQLAQSLPATSS